jgi:hypothetical protein
MKALSINPPIRLGLGLSVFTILALASACATEGDTAAFRGDEHESSGTDTGGDTGEMKTSGEDTHGKDVGDEAGDTGEGGACPRTQGYWKNWNIHADQEHRQIAWPISEDTVGCEQTWYDWLWTPPQGDAWIILAHQWIAASLNEAAGVDVPDDVSDALGTAAALLDDCSIADEDRETAIATSELLDAFNNGHFTESCDDGDDGDDGGDHGDDDHGDDDHGDDKKDCEDDDGDDGDDDDDDDDDDDGGDDDKKDCDKDCDDHD